LFSYIFFIFLSSFLRWFLSAGRDFIFLFFRYFHAISPSFFLLLISLTFFDSFLLHISAHLDYYHFTLLASLHYKIDIEHSLHIISSIISIIDISITPFAPYQPLHFDDFHYYFIIFIIFELRHFRYSFYYAIYSHDALFHAVFAAPAPERFHIIIFISSDYFGFQLTISFSLRHFIFAIFASLFYFHFSAIITCQFSVSSTFRHSLMPFHFISMPLLPLFITLSFRFHAAAAIAATPRQHLMPPATPPRCRRYCRHAADIIRRFRRRAIRFSFSLFSRLLSRLFHFRRRFISSPCLSFAAFFIDAFAIFRRF